MINTHTSPVVIRGAVPRDALCIGVIGMQVFLDTYATEGIRESIAREVLESFSPDVISKLLIQPDIALFVAQMNGHLIGFAQIAMQASHELICTPNVAELQRLYVQERFTGKGIGYRLLQEAEKHAQLGGASMLWATVWAGNERALDFYPRQAYEHLGSPSYVFQNETHKNLLFGKKL